MSLTGWPPSIPQISGFNLRTTLCRKHIFHAFSATEKTRAESLRSLSAWFLVVQNVVLCFPGRWNWNRKLLRSQTWGFHMLEDPCSMTCDIGLWKMRLLNVFKYAFALWVLPVHDNRLLILLSSRMNQVQERTSRKNYTYMYTIMTLWPIHWYNILNKPWTAKHCQTSRVSALRRRHPAGCERRQRRSCPTLAAGGPPEPGASRRRWRKPEKG